MEESSTTSSSGETTTTINGADVHQDKPTSSSKPKTSSSLPIVDDPELDALLNGNQENLLQNYNF
jgi:hypothetical protein